MGRYWSERYSVPDSDGSTTVLPTPAELDRLVTLYESELLHYRTDADAAKKMAGCGEGDVAELAAWTVVGNVLLNLDEMITKG